MKNVIFAAALGAAMLCSGAALADQTQAVQATPAVAMSNGSDVVCRSMIHNGDIIKKQTCMTRTQWDQMKVRDRQYLRNVQMRGDLQIAR
jgi:Spy/CpxP family protein refolding chaperone